MPVVCRINILPRQIQTCVRVTGQDHSRLKCPQSQEALPPLRAYGSNVNSVASLAMNPKLWRDRGMALLGFGMPLPDKPKPYLL